MVDRLTFCRQLLKMLLLVGAMLAASCAGKRGLGEGTWTGTIGGGTAKPVGVRFVLEDENGKLVGKTSFQDPVTGEYGDDGTLTGTRDGTTAMWTTETDVVIKGTFENNTFNGTLEFPPDEGRPTHPVPLTLTK